MTDLVDGRGNGASLDKSMKELTRDEAQDQGWPYH